MVVVRRISRGHTTRIDVQDHAACFMLNLDDFHQILVEMMME
jgi:hypothetical protein